MMSKPRSPVSAPLMFRRPASRVRGARELPAVARRAMLVALLVGLAVCTSGVLFPSVAQAQPRPPGDEGVLGEFVVTGRQEEHVTTLAVLPSLAPDLEDVIVRSVVRRDLELSGMFKLLQDKVAPDGLYGFTDPVDVAAWRKVGAEVIVKVAARKHESGKIQVLGLAYFLDVGKEPVYEKKLLVPKELVRETAHRITDALLGAITGRPGGFASHFTFSAKWGHNRRLFTMDSDGHDLTPLTDPELTVISPDWNAEGDIFYAVSKNYAPFKLTVFDGKQHRGIPLIFKRQSVYSVAVSADGERLALAVAEDGGSAIYTAKPDGSDLTKVSKTDLATHPAFSPSGKLAWIGGAASNGTQRVYVEGKVASPAGFTAAAPTFCDTEDGIRLVYAVAVGGDRQDLVIASETGGSVARLTQNQGSNTYPACSPDGRLLAFFSTRSGQPGTYMMSLKRWTTQKISSQIGESLNWASLPPPPEGTLIP